MEYFVRSGNADKQRAGTVAVGIFDRRKLSESAESLDEITGGQISSVLRRGDMDGKLGHILTLHQPQNALCDRIMLVGCGKERDFDTSAYKKAQMAVARSLSKTGGKDFANYLSDLPVKNGDVAWRVKQAILTLDAALYQYDETRSLKAESVRIERMVITVPRRLHLPEAEIAATEAIATAKGVKLARDLGNLPGNVCTPSYLAKKAKSIAKSESKLKTKILSEDDMQELGMGSLLSVSRGSREQAKLIVMEYKNGPADQKPTVLVGKGLTFDAGGISIKPAAKMDEMKYDMCGGASVIGTMTAIAAMKLKLNVVGVVPASENLPDGKANKPGDVVKSLSGQTIEILNTDAEGRLILCDALTWAEQNYDVDEIIDIATLTGACVVALGHHRSGLMSNSSPLARALLAAGDTAGDKAWQLPLDAEYDAQLKSPFADIANIGGPGGGTITAGCFLQRFTKKMRWAHLDIAGTAWTSGANKSSTGRPVPLLTQFLIDKAAKQNSA